MTKLLKLSAAIGWDENGWTGGVVPATGVLSWAPSTKADLASAAAYYWPGATITAEEGDEDTAVFTTRLTGRVADAVPKSHQLVITLADLSVGLDRPVVTARFAGTGAAEGGSEATGRAKRRAWGRVFNIPGNILDKANNIYEFGDPNFKWQSFEVVRDMGRDASPAPTVISWAGSVAATLTALIASTPVQGSGCVAPSIACVKWWTQPAGPLTADVKGEIGAGYVETAPEIAAAILAAASGPAITNTATAAAWRSGAAGIHLDEDENINAVLNRLLMGVSLLWIFNAGAGTITLREITFSSPVESIASDHVDRERTFPPVKTRRVGFQRSYRLHGDGEIAASLLQMDPASGAKLDGIADGAGRNMTPVYKRSATQPATPTGNGTPTSWSPKPSGIFTSASSSGLAASANNTTFTKTGAGGSWDQSFRSLESHAGDIEVSFKASQTTANLMIGFNTDPATDNNYTGIDVAMWVTSSGTLHANLSGTLTGPFGTYTTGDTLGLKRIGSTVTLVKNGTALVGAPTPTIAAATALYLDSSFNEANSAVNTVAFGPSPVLIGTDPIWVSYGEQKADETLVGTWSPPIRLTDAEAFATTPRFIGFGPPEIAVPYDYLGTTTDTLPRDYSWKLYKQGVEITAGVTWTYAVTQGTFNTFTSASGSKTMSGTGVGTLTASSLGTNEATLLLTAVHEGVPTQMPMKFKKDIAAAPVGGGGGGTLNSKTSGFTDVNSTTYVDVTGALAVTMPTGKTAVNVSINADYFPDSGANGSWTLQAKLQRSIASVWTDVGSPASLTASATSAWNSADGGGEYGNLAGAIAETGLTAGSVYSYRVMARITAGPRNHTVTGSMVITA
ncbi:MAG TPA: hypothetical protein VE053_06680 [Allosphingosinicella sp.]|nr:hypothetical protein [Allosphingosinicella sp.]